MSASQEFPAPTQHYWTVRGQRVRVPYIAPWSGEAPRSGPLKRHHGIDGVRLGFEDELAIGDRHGTVLWTRAPLGRGKGTPYLAKVHPLRQRRCITRHLCQICGGSVVGSRRDERFLFVMRAENGAEIAEGEVTAMPPVHEECAGEAITDCPELRKGWAAALVEYIPAWGVAGILYDPRTLRPLPPPRDRDLAYVSYEEESRLRWIVAAREVITLEGVTPVSLSDLALAT